MGTLKPNEIRIGNYIKIFNIVTQIEGYCIWDNVVQSSQYSERTLDEFEPIQLTEEWLLKFGFNKDDEYENTFNRYCTLFTGFTIFKIDISVNIVSIDAMELEIEYIHQLQNLYFALSGGELTIKEVN